MRIRPALAPEDANQLEQLASDFRALADRLDTFRDTFVVAPSGANQTSEPVPAPLRLASVHALPEGEPA